MLLQLYDDVNQLKERLRERTRELNNVKPQLERKDAEIQSLKQRLQGVVAADLIDWGDEQSEARSVSISPRSSATLNYCSCVNKLHH